MKKLLILIPLILAIFSCVDSELVVPGENVGDGGIDDNPTNPTTTILKKYDYTSPFYNYQYNYNSNGELERADVEVSLLGETMSSTASFNYTNGLLTQVISDSNSFSDQTDIIYNENNQPIELNAGTSPENKLVLTYTGNDISATRTLDGNEDNTYAITLDSSGYIDGYTFTDVNSGNAYELMLNLSGNSVTSSLFKENGTTTQQIDFEYDNKINPIYNQTIDTFNLLILLDLFEFDAEDPTLAIDTYALYRSANNVTHYVAEGSGTAYIDGDVSMNFEYTEEGFPTNATITVADEEEPGTIEYTYY